MFKIQYQQLMNQVKPDPELVQKTVHQARRKIKSQHQFYSFRKPVIAFVSVCLCISFAMPVLAATVEPIYQMIYMVSPAAAQFFMPVQKSDEDNGINMEVVSAFIHGNMAEIYVSMQDLTGDRIDGTTDLYDSYSINRPFDSSAYCERVAFDENTKTATFLIIIEEWGEKDIAGDKITFSVKEFLSHKNIYEKVAVPFDLSKAADAVQTQTVYTLGGGGTAYENDDGESIVLIPGKALDSFPVEGIDITAIGYIEGKLHVQMALKNRLKNDAHGSFFLLDGNDRIFNSKYHVYFTNQYKNSEDRIDYCEYVFDIPQEEISGYRLYGDFVTSGMLTEGHWRVTFPLVQTE